MLFFYLILRYQFTFFSIVYHDKIWAHKVNDVEKLDLTREKFSGVELDIVYMGKLNKFDIHHPPELPSDFYLFDYFKKTTENKKLKYWLDYKNLNDKNHILSSKLLDSIVSYYKINRMNIIVESTSPRYLKLFSKYGFRTAYYLPSNLKFLDSVTLNLKLREIEGIIKNNKNIDFVSSYLSDYKIIRSRFPNTNFIGWTLEIDKPIFTSYKYFKKTVRKFFTRLKILNDSSVEVVLIRFIYN